MGWNHQPVLELTWTMQAQSWWTNSSEKSTFFSHFLPETHMINWKEVCFWKYTHFFHFLSCKLLSYNLRSLDTFLLGGGFKQFWFSHWTMGFHDPSWRAYFSTGWGKTTKQFFWGLYYTKFHHFSCPLNPTMMVNRANRDSSFRDSLGHNSNTCVELYIESWDIFDLACLERLCIYIYIYYIHYRLYIHGSFCFLKDCWWISYHFVHFEALQASLASLYMQHWTFAWW